MAAAGARAQKPVGSAAWIAAEKENMADLVEQELEEVEYPVRHEMDWLNEHMAEIFSKGQANFTDVFKTPGKMRGKTPRTARKRNVEENRVVSCSGFTVTKNIVVKLTSLPQPLSEIFSSAHKTVENKAAPSPSPFIHRIVSKTNATATTSASAASPAISRSKTLEKASQPQYPDLTQNLNSFSQYNTDSGYHGMQDDDEMILPDTQPNTQTSTQPFEADEHAVLSPQVDVSIDQQPTEDSFHSAQENVRLRGETVEPVNIDPTPAKERITRPAGSVSKAPEPEMDSTPKARMQPKSKIATAAKKRQESPVAQQVKEKTMDDEPLSKAEASPEVSRAKEQNLGSPDVEMEEAVNDTILDDNFDDIGSPSDGSTPERFPMRKSSLNFASLPAREPLKPPRRSRTSHIDLQKLSSTGRPSLLGKQSGGRRMTQEAAEDEMADAGTKDLENAKDAEDTMDVDQVSKIHNQKSTQSLHDRISMLGKLQPSRPKKSMASMAGLSAGQVPYPELPAAKPESKPEPPSQKERPIPTQEPDEMDVDDWIRPLSSPQRLDLTKSKTTDVMEKLFDVEQSTSKTVGMNAREQQSTEPERPKSSYSIFSSPRPHGHHKTASVSNIASEASTTPTGSPRRFDGPPQCSAKGLFTSTGGSTRLETSSPEQPRLRPQEQASAVAETKEDQRESQPRQISSPPRQEGRRTRSSTEREEKRRQKERDDREREEEEIRQEKAREKEKQRAMQLKAMQDKSSVEPEERPGNTAQRSMQPSRQQSREPESAHDGSRFGLPQPKQTDRRPKPPTREPAQKPNPRPVSIRVGSTLSRPMPIPSSMTSNSQEPAAPAAAPVPASKTASLKKKGSNQSLHTSSSASSFKSSVSSQTQAQRKKKEQEEREVRRKEEQRKEEQKREADRRRALQKQQEEEARRQAEAERERAAQEDPKKSAHMRAIERRRQENNARKHVRQGSQQVVSEAPPLQHERPASQAAQRNDLGATRPASRLGYGRTINPPAPNPAKPPKRNMDEEAGYRSAVTNPSNAQPSGEAKRRKTEDEHNPMQPVRPTMAPPIRQSNIRKVDNLHVYSNELAKQPSMFGGQPGSSIFKTGQPQRPAHPSELAKYSNNKIPFAEPNHAPPPAVQKPAAPGSAQRPPPVAKPSPKYPSGESIHLPEIATDSEDEDDSDSEMFPVPKWAQPKELEGLLRQQDGMEVDSIFGPIAPFSLEETFKADKKIKKYRDRTSSANWNGPDGLTQEEIRKDRIERQKLRLNGGWSFQQ
ncbi:uncharacterized protein N7496_002166 [Penicillium cataractarum]|uniref:Inner centromere protein ARK-binding domain-containing protein n=1 Tax=Penicillium cataractarum TaxID=2100454 RepID=A0A9W9SNQ2_9EURO|nr:uncharacterized protein N7496_002166 [Penicillium cataractarum]KAJ5379738.1 hypothetical protein N7496_002166 [Penicillium cataractarum]